MRVVCTKYLKQWLRKPLITGEEAVFLLSDLLPDYLDFDESGHIAFAETICVRPLQRSSFITAKRPPPDNPIPRLECSIVEKSNLISMEFANGKSELQRPEDWLSWAIDKNFNVFWLEYALDEGYFPALLARIQGNERLLKRYMPNHALALKTAILTTSKQGHNGEIVGDNQSIQPRQAPIPEQVNEAKVVERGGESAKERRANLDISSERGCRRQILTHWENILRLYGDGVDARQVLNVLKRHQDETENIPTLKTVQNRMIELRNEKLIP